MSDKGEERKIWKILYKHWLLTLKLKIYLVVFMPLPTTQVGQKMLVSYDATGKFAFNLFEISVMMSRFCLT